MSQISGAVNFGTVRHNPTSDWLFFGLENAGTPFSASAPAIGTGSGKVSATIELPDDTSHDIHTSGVPSNTVEEITASSGFYRLRLWGSGQSTPHNKPLLQVGRYGIHIYSTTGDFEPIFGFYDVQADFDIHAAFVYTPGSGGADLLAGSLTFYHWSTHELITTPQSALTSLSLVVRDAAGTAIVNYTNISTQFTQAQDSLFFTKSSLGVVGNQVLVARVTAVYAGFTYKKDFLIAARFPA